MSFFNPKGKIKIGNGAKNKKPKIKSTGFVVKEKTKCKQNKISQSNVSVTDRK